MHKLHRSGGRTKYSYRVSSNRNAVELPVGRCMPVSSEQVLRKDSNPVRRFIKDRHILIPRTDRVSTAERQDNRLDGKSDRKQVLWSRKCLLRINHLGTRSIRKIRGVFEMHTERRDGREKAEEPVDHAEPNGPGPLENRGCCDDQTESSLSRKAAFWRFTR